MTVIKNAISLDPIEPIWKIDHIIILSQGSVQSLKNEAVLPSVALMSRSSRFCASAI
jgi:hypothetical protein